MLIESERSALTTLAAAVEGWFAANQRPLPWRRRYDPYHVWVSEVMLQQTRMEVVLRFYERFLERFPDVTTLARAAEEDVLAAWSGLGYYRRARMLRQGAIAVVERYGGRVPETVPELSTIPGIGRYTAGAIASIAHRHRAPIVDGNVARILSRLFAIAAPLASPRLMSEAWKLAERTVEASDDPRMFNQGLMEIGALICKPVRPLCGSCPVQFCCAAFQQGRVHELPGPKQKGVTRELDIRLYLVIDPGGRLLMRREEGPLMSGMFQLPHDNSSLFPAAPLPLREETRLGAFRHTITDRRIRFTVFTATLTGIADGDGYRWIDLTDLGAVPHPSYVSKALRLLTKSAEPLRGLNPA